MDRNSSVIHELFGDTSFEQLVTGLEREINNLLWHLKGPLGDTVYSIIRRNPNPTETFLYALHDRRNDRHLVEAFKAYVMASRSLYYLLTPEAKSEVDSRQFTSPVETPVGVLTGGISLHPNEQVQGNRLVPSPACPKIFHGRDEIVSQIVGAIASSKPVALFGVGGIGKTSIALAALHHPDVVLKFGDNRRFIPCDELGEDITLNSLLELIATYVGFKGGDRHQGFLLAFLSMHPILLVLDNAETILDYPQIYDTIATFITALASTENISLLVTSRSTALPADISWNRMDVQVLDADAAKRMLLAFHAVEDCDQLDELLEHLGYHPLSIKLIAQVGAWGRLSALELLERWMKYRTRFLDLHNGGRLSSLRVCLEVSLSSPSLLQIPITRDVLSILAFLPQGIEGAKCQEIFPSIAEIDLVMDSLHRLSLIEKRRGRITLLPPIRSYIQETTPMAQKLEDDVRMYYLDRLHELRYSVPGDETYRMGKLFIYEEDINCETVIIKNSGSRHSTCYSAADAFIRLLDQHKRRKTKLTDIIRNILEEEDYDYIHCLQSVGLLEFQTANYRGAEKILLRVHRLWSNVGFDYGKAAAASLLGCIHRFMGNSQDAEIFFLQARSLVPESDRHHAAFCDRQMAAVYLQQGNLTKARALAVESLLRYRRLPIPVECMWLLLVFGEIELVAQNSSSAKSALIQAKGEAIAFGDDGLLEKCDRLLGDIEIDAGRYSQARNFLEGARKLAAYHSDAHDVALCDASLGRVEEGLAQYETARVLYQKARDEIVLIGAKHDAAECASYLGGIERKLGDLGAAVEWFATASEEFIYIRAFPRALPPADAIRSLGDQMLVRGEREAAKRAFGKAKELYSNIGNLDGIAAIRVREGRLGS